MIQEDKTIKALQTTSAGGFISDDAAVLPNVDVSNRYVISKDLLVENVLFERHTLCRKISLIKLSTSI